MKLNANFFLSEFLPPELYSSVEKGEISEFVATGLINPLVYEFIFEFRKVIGKPIRVNDWIVGGQFKNRGYRLSSWGGDKNLSQHKNGNAIDFDTPNHYSPQELRTIIVDNQDKWPFIGFIEVDINWVHVDFRYTKSNDIIFWSPTRGTVQYNSGI
tara:strand:- start:605 stop:1072 length:468 start_codon:yes stop_codon:yes gene_type:complete